MSNSPAPGVRDAHEVDPRVARTTQAIGRALVALLQERDLADITVQQVLERAGVGRATFYAHYRSKEDALHASYERLFSALEPWLARRSPVGERLFPVTEFLEHVGSARQLVRALRASGEIETVWALCAGHAARLIERRLPPAAGRDAALPPALAARVLAASLVELLRWWEERPDRMTPLEVDVAFHAHARRALGG